MKQNCLVWSFWMMNDVFSVLWKTTKITNQTLTKTQYSICFQELYPRCILGMVQSGYHHTGKFNKCASVCSWVQPITHRTWPTAWAISNDQAQTWQSQPWDIRLAPVPCKTCQTAKRLTARHTGVTRPEFCQSNGTEVEFSRFTSSRGRTAAALCGDFWFLYTHNSKELKKSSGQEDKPKLPLFVFYLKFKLLSFAEN